MSVIGSNGILLVFPFQNVVLTSSDSLNPTLFRSFSIASSHALSSCLCVCLSLSLPLYLSISLPLFLSLFFCLYPSLSISLFLSLIIRQESARAWRCNISEWVNQRHMTVFITYLLFHFFITLPLFPSLQSYLSVLILLSLCFDVLHYLSLFYSNFTHFFCLNRLSVTWNIFSFSVCNKFQSWCRTMRQMVMTFVVRVLTNPYDILWCETLHTSSVHHFFWFVFAIFIIVKANTLS